MTRSSLIPSWRPRSRTSSLFKSVRLFCLVLRCGGFANLLEELPQRLNELQALTVHHPLGQTADVVVGWQEVSIGEIPLADYGVNILFMVTEGPLYEMDSMTSGGC